ncbi:MAG: LysM peptidoglycan-binding domain-containing protein [Bacteriovoracaceae bacterium]|jgi:hypothetical protein|nr:LysM peptidoglycan-binding domain-containing protein [Bacteriovoracaceae bacterium]
MKYSKLFKFLEKIKAISTLSLIVVVNLLFAQSSHIVVRKDTLSQISLKYLGAPVYGTKGSLKKVLELNHFIENENYIVPGQVILLSDVTVSQGKESNQQIDKEDAEAKNTSFAKDEESKGQFISLYLGGVYDSMHEEDPYDGIIVSHLQPYLSFSYNFNFNTSWLLGVGFELEHASYLQNGNKDKSIKNRKFVLSGLYVDLNKDIDYKVLLESRIGFKEMIFYESNNDRTIYTLNKGRSPFFRIHILKSLFKKNEVDIYGLLHLRNIFESDSSDYKGGFDYGLGFSGRWQDIEIKTIYHQGDFKASSQKYQHRWFDIIGKYNWRF